MRRRSVRGAALTSLAAALVLVAGGCSDDGGAGGDGGTGGGTLGVATLPPVQTTLLTTTVPVTAAVATTSLVTVPVATTAVATTALVTTVPTTTRPTTTAVPTTAATAASAAPCDLTAIVTQTDTAYDGVTPTELHCAEDWATWIGQPDDQFSDGYFAVARWTGSTWALMNLGTSGICTDADVPTRLWDALGCFE